MLNGPVRSEGEESGRNSTVRDVARHSFHVELDHGSVRLVKVQEERETSSARSTSARKLLAGIR